MCQCNYIRFVFLFFFYIDMSNEKILEEQQEMDDDSDEYDYEDIKQEGESNNGTIQQSMKHFQPTNKLLSKYVLIIYKKKKKNFFCFFQDMLIKLM